MVTVRRRDRPSDPGVLGDVRLRASSLSGTRSDRLSKPQHQPRQVARPVAQKWTVPLVAASTFVQHGREHQPRRREQAGLGARPGASGAAPGQATWPRRASIIWLTRSVRSPLAITQQSAASTATARNTTAPSAGRPTPASTAARERSGRRPPGPDVAKTWTLPLVALSSFLQRGGSGTRGPAPRPGRAGRAGRCSSTGVFLALVRRLLAGLHERAHRCGPLRDRLSVAFAWRPHSSSAKLDGRRQLGGSGRITALQGTGLPLSRCPWVST